MSVYFGLYEIILVEKTSVSCKTVKAPGTVLYSERKCWENGIVKLPGKWQDVVEQNGNTLFNKDLGENEKCVFYFYLKNEGTF